MQITIADVDQDGRALQTGTTFALCGQVRAMGESDDSLNRLATKAGRAYFLTGLSLHAHAHIQSSGTSGHTKSKIYRHAGRVFVSLCMSHTVTVALPNVVHQGIASLYISLSLSFPN